jgi:hypothetical protein
MLRAIAEANPDVNHSFALAIGYPSKFGGENSRSVVRCHVESTVSPLYVPVLQLLASIGC